MQISTSRSANLKTWAEQRDAALLEAARAAEELRAIQAKVSEAAAASDDLQRQIALATGRLAEIAAREEAALASVSRDVAALASEKSALDVAVSAAKSELGSVRDEIVRTLENIEGMAEFRDATFSKISNMASSAESVAHAVRVGTDAVEALVARLGKSVGALVESVDRRNAETAQLVDKVPAMLLDMKRQKLTRTRI